MALMKSNTIADKKVRQLTAQMQTFRTSITSQAQQIQRQLTHLYNKGEPTSEKRVDQVIRTLLEKVPAVIISQSESGQNHRDVLKQILTAEDPAAEDITAVIKKHNSNIQRIWQSSDPTALAQVCLGIIHQQQMNKKKPVAVLP
ncbi:hypothetical protein [Echinimonas agarilytica]|nr:hypothetical protein [Echinimonas agarilytica]